MHLRLGPWDTPTRAEAARAEAILKGFSNAVVVVENASSPPATPTTAYAKTLGAPILEAPTATEYYIRLLATEKPENFNARQIESVGGRLEKWPLPDGKTTAIMLTGFTRLDDAKRAVDRLRAGAFPEAYIIQNEQGKMRRYRY